MEEPDEQLMTAFRDGSAEAFERLYERFRGSLYRYFIAQCSSDRDVANDLFLDVWTRLIQARVQYQPSAPFPAYLFGIAHNRLIDHYRAQTRGLPPSFERDWLEPEASSPNGNDRAASDDLEYQAIRMKALLLELPEAQREVFLLREETGLSLDQIAEVVGVGRETVKSRLRYAIAKLRRNLSVDGVNRP